MKYNPKVVPFDRSAAYVHHRALKNMRANKPLDALELMRHAVENSPDNREYRLDLAEMYCELGLHEQSNRILLDLLAGKDAPAECYYGLALNQFGRNELESARQALTMYDFHASDGEYMEDAGNLRAEMDFYDAMRRPVNRRLGRAQSVASRACDALRGEDPGRACRLFRRSLQMLPGQEEIRALYAMALKLNGEESEALDQARRCASLETPSVRTICVTAQVLWLCGREEEARTLAHRAIDERPAGVELRLLIFALAELGMYTEAAEAVKDALQEEPLDRMLLHLRAVTLHRAGAPDELVGGFWLRILRVDPDDSVARFYYDAAAHGVLEQTGCELIYEVPGEEFRRRMLCIAQTLSLGLDAAVERWRSDKEFRQILCWAAGNGEENCGRAAVMIIASAADAESEGTLRELLYRSDVPLSVKRHALVCLQLRGARLKNILPPGVCLRDELIEKPDALLGAMPVGERQLIRLAAEELEYEYGLCALSALTATWRAYRARLAGRRDPLISTQEAAAALAWTYLKQRGRKPSLEEIARLFACKPRRLAHYAKLMEDVLDGGEITNEDH